MSVYDLGFSTTKQELSLNSLHVQGKIPSWLQGSLIRNGPGTFEVGAQTYRHWFDGLAMLHKFSFGNGQVSYANKFLQTRAYSEAMETGKISYSEFATDPCRSLFARVMAVFNPKITDSAKVSVAKIADQYTALAETPIQVQFDPQTLESVGVFDYEKETRGNMTTVHPHFDFERNEVYNLATRFHRISHYQIYKIANGGRAPKMIGSLPVKEPAYMHSFGITENYVILAEFPLVVNPLNLLLWLKPYIENFRWKPERGTPFWVMNRHTGELVGRYESDTFFAFHHVNAFEQGDELVVDIVAYPDADIVNAFYLNRLKDQTSELPFGNLRRYRIPLKGTTATYETISDVCMELPRFDYDHYNMRGDYRYVYASSVNPQQRQGFYNQIVKVDIETGQSQTWFEENRYPGEPVFVPAPDRKYEDDGVVLSVVLDADKGSSFLLVLDAQTFTEQARAEIPQPVLFGYHGAYFPEIGPAMN
jgi:beta,beta-carotene 9',10'-dioxygenase